MKTPLLWLTIFAAAIANASAYSDEIYDEQPLIQAQFDRLISRSFPTITTDFDKLLQVDFSSLIHPDVPHIHITENLSRPTEQPLLIVY
jgi:hypothetical protein